jgi:hypothetical protein
VSDRKGSPLRIDPATLVSAFLSQANRLTLNKHLKKCRKTWFDRGRNGALVCTAPPSEPDWRISRIRLSGWWFYLFLED